MAVGLPYALNGVDPLTHSVLAQRPRWPTASAEFATVWKQNAQHAAYLTGCRPSSWRLLGFVLAIEAFGDRDDRLRIHVDDGFEQCVTMLS